jgi:type VI secretion system secreted protein VgrG
MTFIDGQTTGLGVATQILVPGNETPISTKRGYNDVFVSLSGANGPTAFQLVPVLADVAGNPVLESPVTLQLGAAAAYALLGYSGITNTGATVIAGGNAGSFPTTTITGLTGSNFTAPATIDNVDAAAAQTALAAAILYYQGLTPTLSGLSDLSTGGNGSTAATYTPGVYVGASSLTMPTGIILDAQGNPNAVFVFVAGSTLNLASGQSVALLNGAQAANVVFVAGSSFTSVATSTLNGNVLAVVSVTLGGGTLNGRALANTGAVTIAAATATTTPAPIAGTNELTYVAYGSRTVTGQTYIPSGTSTPVATVSQTGLITAVARGAVEVEVSFPAFDNSIGDIVSPGNIMNGLPVNKIFTSVNVQVLV